MRKGTATVLGAIGCVLCFVLWSIHSGSRTHETEHNMRVTQLSEVHRHINQRSVHYGAHQAGDKAKVVDDGGAPERWYAQCNADWREQVCRAPSCC